MILDQLSQCRRHAAILPGFARAFEFLRQVDAHCAAGRHKLDGENIFALVQRYTTKPVAKAALEAHRKYADVQFLAAGHETILWAPLTALNVETQSYSPEKDIAFFGMVPDARQVHLSAGQFAIFFPEDGHAPGLEWNGASEVLKVVVKVRV